MENRPWKRTPLIVLYCMEKDPSGLKEQAQEQKKQLKSHLMSRLAPSLFRDISALRNIVTSAGA